MQQNPYLNEIHYKSDNAISFLAGGISNIYPSKFIQDDEVQDMENMCLDFYPAISTKIGRTELRNPGLQGEEIKYFNIAGVNYMFYIQGQTLKDITGTAIATGITGTKFSHVYYKDGNNEYLVLYGEGVIPTRHKLPLSPLNIPEILTLPKDDDNNDIYFDNMCYHKNRMIGSKGSMLYFSGLQNPNDWTSVENSRIDNVENCRKITGLASFDNKLIVFSEENMHLYYGSNTQAGTSNSYTCVTLDNNIGCYSQNTIKVHNSMLYWLFGRNIYEYDGSTIRNIEKPTSNNGITGGIQKYINGLTINEAKKVSIAGSDDKIYFYFPDYGYMLIFDQRLRKWAKELQPTHDINEISYVSICDSFNNLNFSQTPAPIYALTANGVIYEITGGKKEGLSYLRRYGYDEYTDSQDVVYTEPIPYYLKTKEFTEGVISKRKALSELWFNYDLDGVFNLKITTNTGKQSIIENALPQGTNKTECILIPTNMQNFNSYTFEMYGEGDLKIYNMERKYRTKTR